MASEKNVTTADGGGGWDASADAKSSITPIQLHQVQIKANITGGLSQMFSWEFKATPDTGEVIAKGFEYVRLSGGIRVETFELIWAGRQRGNDFLVTLLKPIIGLPLQEHEDATHLLLEK